MSVQDLRERALARTSSAMLKRRIPLDDALEETYTNTKDALEEARREEPQASEGRYSDAPPSVAGEKAVVLVEQLESELEKAKKATYDASVWVVFKRLPAPEYQALLFRNTTEDGDQLNLQAFVKDVLDQSFLRVEGSDGADLKISLAEARESLLTHGEIDTLQSALIEHNRRVVLDPS